MTRRKLSDQQIHAIRRYHDQGWSSARIATKFGVYPSTIRAITSGKTYSGPATSYARYDEPTSFKPVEAFDSNAGRSYALAPRRVAS